jgi:hypothetical protein
MPAFCPEYVTRLGMTLEKKNQGLPEKAAR